MIVLVILIIVTMLAVLIAGRLLSTAVWLIAAPLQLLARLLNYANSKPSAANEQNRTARNTDEMERRKRCPYCGEEILEIAIKCKHCGSTLEAANTAPTPAFADAAALPARKSAVLRPILGSVGVAGVMLYGLSHCNRSATVSTQSSTSSDSAVEVTAATRPASAARASDASPADAPKKSNVDGSQPSFNCAKAHSRAETLICGDPDLAALDREIATLYKSAMNVTPDKASLVRKDRNEWRRREQSCVDKDCLVGWYAERRSDLSNIVAGFRPGNNLRSQAVDGGPPPEREESTASGTLRVRPDPAQEERRNQESRLQASTIPPAAAPNDGDSPMPADWHDPQMWTHYKAQVHEDFGRMLRHQLAGCQAQECRARLQAAHDWLVWHELHDLATDILPMPDCPNVMSVDLMKGARCTAVQIDMCPKASLNDTQSFFRCEQALKDGAWMANPKAQALDLDKWVRPKGP